MNWVISNTDKMECHTLLSKISIPLQPYLKEYNWIFSNVEFLTKSPAPLPINFDKEYFILTSEDFIKVLDMDVQIIRGVLLAIPRDQEISINESNLPFVVGNDRVWVNGNIQLPNADIEIDCFDSSSQL